MSRSQTKNKMCVGKSKYVLKEEAIRAVRRARENGATNMRFYECRVCHYWHIGHLLKPRHKR